MGFQIPWAVFQIPEGKNVGILLESGFPCIGRDSSELLRSFSYVFVCFCSLVILANLYRGNSSLRITLCYRRYGKTIIIGVFWNPAIESFLPSIICHSNKLSAKIQFYKMFLFFKTQNFQYQSDLHVLSWCETRFNLKHPITSWISAQRLSTGCF